ELGARLTDRLRGDDPDGLAELDLLAGREALAVTGAADPLGGLAGQHRTDAYPVDPRVLGDAAHLGVTEHQPGVKGGAVREAHRLGEHSPVGTGLEVVTPPCLVGDDPFDPDAARRAAVLLADDEL